MTAYNNTASVGITFVDELHNFDLKKCGKSSRRHRAVRSQRSELEETERELTEINIQHQHSRAQFVEPPVLLAEIAVPGKQFEEHSNHQLGQHSDLHHEQKFCPKPWAAFRGTF